MLLAHNILSHQIPRDKQNGGIQEGQEGEMGSRLMVQFQICTKRFWRLVAKEHKVVKIINFVVYKN